MTRTHLLIDWWTEDLDLLSHPQPMMTYMQEAAEVGQHTVVGSALHQFSPAGFTAVVLLAESHLSVHSWVKEGLLTVDIFSCRSEGLLAMLDYLRQRVRPLQENIAQVERGVVDLPNRLTEGD